MGNVVASGHPRVTETACELLQAGGNAFDAAVGAGFASAVAEPGLTSLGGGGFLLARTARGQSTLFDFFVDTPGLGRHGNELEPHFLPMTVHFPSCDQIFNVGLGSAAVPGNLRGFLHVHKRLGRLPLKEVLAPTIELARQGLELNDFQAYVLDLLHPIMTLTTCGRQLFEPNGQYLRQGDRFINPALANFLETLPETGDREFYGGALARRIARNMDNGRGLLTETDLASYRVIERAPLGIGYRNHYLLTNPPPSFGGPLIALSLRLLEGLDMGTLIFGSPLHLERLVTVLEEVDRRRADGYLHPQALSERNVAESMARIRTASGGTTHISICDAEGNVASMTTSNGEGSGYLVPDTGIMLNNMMGEDDLHPEGFHESPPGMRVASMMSPSLVLGGDQVRLVVGSGGSKRIRTALLQVMSNVVDFNMDLEQAVEAPRLHWDGDCVQIEPGFGSDTLRRLERRWPINPWTVRDVYFGGVHGVSPPGQGAGDPRRGGCARMLA